MRRRRVTPEGCWEWTGARTAAGYGQIRNGKGRWLYVHRVSASVLAGLDVDGQVVLHTCDNPHCFNPDHLRVGTHADNIADAVTKRRHAHGERSGRAVLTEDDVTAIREIATCDLTHREISEITGVHKATVRDILQGRSWQLVQGGEEHERELLDAWDLGRPAAAEEARDG